ncbi:MAG: sialidase family protein, partial [Polyangiaceae bacterium]
MARGWTAVLFLATTMTAACGDVSSGGAPDGPDAQTSQDVDGGVDASVGDGGVNDGATPAEPIGPSSGTLYEPNPATNPDDMVSYPHAILLQQAGALHGTILATFERQVQTAGDPTRGWLIYRSIDSGRSFERLGVPVVPAHFASTSNVLQPNLLELAHAAGKTAAGTLLLSGVAGAGTKLEAQVFQSTDGGASFQFLSVIESGDTAVSAERPWEPFLIQLDDGSIVAYWSDELVPGGRQNIARKISHDGGVTWGAKAFVWQSPVDSDRPGMVSIARMGDGRYIMAVEMCGAPGDYCRAHVKTSTDGLVWGAGPADMGVRPLSPSGHPFHGNPFVAWTPSGGPNGTVILSARDLLKSVATPNDFAGGRTQTLFVSHNGGVGAWYELTAPIAWQQGTTYTQAGYRNALLPLPGSDYLLYFATSYSGAGVRNRIQFATANEGVLPYADPFATNQALGWQTFGGAWTVAGGVYSV